MTSALSHFPHHRRQHAPNARGGVLGQGFGGTVLEPSYGRICRVGVGLEELEPFGPVSKIGVNPLWWTLFS